ncbi:hypothetical protein ABZ023_18680 [Streptomyces sp. NPDC006367]|uniref:hypothetical protein n=1 Tax=unclassified Streptomyces TaxID=2593676 RepID=UPI0033A779B8
MKTVQTTGLGADSWAITLKFLDDPERYGLKPDLSDLVVVHAVTGNEFPDTLETAEKYLLPRLREANVRMVQVSRMGSSDADGIAVLADTRKPDKVFQQGPWRLSDWLTRAGTVPQVANGRRTCSIRSKGWVLDNILDYLLEGDECRRAIGYNNDEIARMIKDSRIQNEVNEAAGRTICTPYYPLIDDEMGRSEVERYVLERAGVTVNKSYCWMCPFSGVAASRERHEARLRQYPEHAAYVLRMEQASLALNENSSLYATSTLLSRLLEDPANEAIIETYRRSLDVAPHAVYEVRRVYDAARTDDCRQHHGKKCSTPRWWCHAPRTETCQREHPPLEHVIGHDEQGAPLHRVDPPWCGGSAQCRGEAKKGVAWRSVRTLFEGSRSDAEALVRKFAARRGAELGRGTTSGIERAHYLRRGSGYPCAEAYLVAAPVGIADKERPGFEAMWLKTTGRSGTWYPPLRDYAPVASERLGGPVPIVRLDLAA